MPAKHTWHPAFEDAWLQRVIDLRQRPSRAAWKRLPVSAKQRDYLTAHGFRPDFLSRIDRGGASIIITHIVGLAREAWAWRPVDGL